MAEAAKEENKGKTKFLEKIGNRPIEMDEYRVDQLRQIASEAGVTGSHDLHKPELVDAINKALSQKS